jgi:integrase
VLLNSRRVVQDRIGNTPILKLTFCDVMLDALFHKMRPTAATLALIQGAHLKVVSEMLGHGTVGLTLDTYSHLLPTMHKQAPEAMDAILTG